MRFPTLYCLWRSRRDQRPVRERPARRRLSVEPLEERAVPANFTAANVAELIAAIDAANLSPEATDRITLVSGTTYTLTASNNSEHGPTGLPVIGSNESLTIVGGSGTTIERSAAEGTPAFRIFDVPVGGSLTLKNLTVQNGLAVDPVLWTGTSEWARGGAIYNQGTLNLDGVTLQNNTAQGQSAGWYFTTFPAGNGEGGAVYSNGSISAVDSVFTNNSAIGGRGLNALTGKKYTGGVPEYYPLPWSGSAGGDGTGGGLYIAGGTASISDTTFTSNTAAGGRGGDGFLKNNGTRTDSGDGGNGYGGGVYVRDGSVAIHGVTVKQNQALAGATGEGPKGQAGKGIGGGLYMFADADVGLDAFTVDHVKQNDASTSHKNIRGTYHTNS